MADHDTLDPADGAAGRRPRGRTPPDPSADAPAGARRPLRPAAAQDRRVRQLPQARRARAPRAGRPGDRRVSCEELLLVVDDFDRALTRRGRRGQPSAYRKGIELIHSKLHDLLRKQGVRPIEALGTDFDPNLHQAVMHEASPGHREGEVIGELRRGYMLGDRLLRPAMVKVAKA